MTARAARVVRGMTLAKASVLVFVAVALLTTVVHGQDESGRGTAGHPTDAVGRPALLRAVAELGPEPDDRGVGDGHHHR